MQLAQRRRSLSARSQPTSASSASSALPGDLESGFRRSSVVPPPGSYVPKGYFRGGRLEGRGATTPSFWPSSKGINDRLQLRADTYDQGLRSVKRWRWK